MPAKARRKPVRAARKPAKASSPAKAFGTLPEWNLADLYPAMDAPELTRDLARADADSAAFEADYKGKLAALIADGTLVEAVRRFEALEDLLGRLISYAGLVYAGNNTDPVRAKFYGDIQEKITNASAGQKFRFRSCEPALAHGPLWTVWRAQARNAEVPAIIRCRNRQDK